MSIKATLSSDGLEEVYTAPTLKEICLYNCLTNKEILTTEVEVDEEMEGSEKLAWEKFRLKEPIQRDLVEALFDAGKNYLFMLTPNYEPVLAAIRMSQPEHLVKVHVNNSATLEDRQLEFLISGGNVKSLDINGCINLRRGSLDAINKFGNKLEYLRIGDCRRVLPQPDDFSQGLAILRTPNVKTFIVSQISRYSPNVTNYWRCLLQDFISNLEDLQISSSGKLKTLEFLEPARNKLSCLTLRYCNVAQNANAWESLFNLDKLRFLDVVGSLIEVASVGESVVQRLLTAMPYLTHLAVDSGFVKDVFLETSIQGQGSVAKRLEFLFIRNIKNKDAGDVRMAKLLANDVAYYGTFEGEFRMLEYYSNLLSIGDYSVMVDLKILLKTMNMMAPCKTVAVIGLLIKIFKNHGVDPLYSRALLQQWKKLFTPDVASKLGTVLVDQCMGVIVTFMSRWSVYDDENDAEPYMFGDLIDIMMNLEGELKAILDDDDHEEEEDDFDEWKKIAGLLKKAVDRFPGETNELWGISSVLLVIKELKEVMVSRENYRVDLMEGLSSLIAALSKLCLTSAPRRAAFHSANGVGIVMDLLEDILDGSFGLADRVSFVLLEILQSIMQDTNLNLSKSGWIASRLEKLLLSVHSKCEFQNSRNPFRKTTHYYQFEGIANLLKILEEDPRYDYEPSADAKEIMMK